QHRTLLALSEAISSHRDLQALFHDLADRLHRVVHFDYLILVLHDAVHNGMRVHILETSEPNTPHPGLVALDEAPSGLVWTTQEPLIIADIEQDGRWPKIWEETFRPNGMTSFCYLPLTTARMRLGVLAFASKQRATFDDADV